MAEERGCSVVEVRCRIATSIFYRGDCQPGDLLQTILDPNGIAGKIYERSC